MPLSLDITLKNSEEVKLRGLYTIDEERLSEIDEQALGSLRDSGYLSAIYTMIASLGQVHALLQKKNQRIDNAKKWFEPVVAP